MLAGRGRLRLAALADARWLDAPEASVPLAELRAATGSGSFVASLALAGPDLRAVTACVAAGLGLALTPVPDGLPPDLVAVPLADPGLLHRTEAVWSGTLTDAPRVFVEALTAPRPDGA